MRRLLFSLLSIVALGFAPAPVFRERPDDPEAVLKRLQGTWMVSRYEQGGQTIFAKGEAFEIKIEKDRWTFFLSRDGLPVTTSSSFALKLDTRGSPAEIDIMSDANKMYMLNGVYHLKGDTLTIVYRVNANGNKDRARHLTKLAPGDCLMQLERRP